MFAVTDENLILAFEKWQTIVDFGLLVLIWLVQLIIYPSFRYADPAQFQSWHNRYTGLISLFVAPLMPAQIGLYCTLATSLGRWQDLAAVALITVAWLATVIYSVPCHDRLHRGGFDLATIDRLVVTNWIRTVAWSMTFALQFA